MSDARYPAFVGGRGSGKSVASILKSLRFINEHQGPGYGMMTVPTLGDIDKILLPRMRLLFGDLEGKNNEWYYNDKKSTFLFPRQQWTVFVRPASEPDSCRGPDLAFASMDEIGTENQYETFRILQSAIRQTGYPNQLWVTTTPNVRRPWIATIWRDHVHPMTSRDLVKERYPIFTASIMDNPHLPEWQRTELVEEYEGTRWARQELYGEFIAVEGVAFPSLDRNVHIRSWPEDQECVRREVGIDFGATSPTALIEWKMSPDKRLWAVDEFYKRNANDYDWVEWCAERNVKVLTCDPSASEDQITSWQQRYGIYIKRSSAKRFDTRYNFWDSRLAVKPDGKPGIYISPKCQNLWEELENLAFHKPRGHEYASDQWVPGSSDHAYDAGAYAGTQFDNYYGAPPRFRITYGKW